MNFLYGFGLALAFVGLAVLCGGVWVLFRIALMLGQADDALTARLVALESKPAVMPLTSDDVRRIVLEMPARPGTEAVPLDMLPRDQMPDQVAVDTFSHMTGAPRTMSARLAAYETRRRHEAAEKKGTPQGGPGKSE